MESFGVKNIHKRFGGVLALKGAELEFEGPKVCGLVGANGSGKSTFAKLCSGLIRRDKGEFYINGKKIEINSPKDARRNKISLAHQNLSLIPDLTVFENIYLGNEDRKNKFFPNDLEAKKQSLKLLSDIMPGEIELNSLICDLTPPQKHLVEIAKALSRRPELLILDEPTAALEYFHVERLFKKILELKDQNISIIFVSHRLWEITKICDLVYVFRNGKTSGFIDFCRQPKDENLIVPLVIGKDSYKDEFLVKESKKSHARKEKPVFELENIFIKNKLNNISLKIRKGEVLGLGGLDSQGQEELLMSIAGAIKLNDGKFFLDGKEIKISKPIDAIRRDIYLVPGDRQEDGLFMSHTVSRNIIFPRFTLRKEIIFLRLGKLKKIVKKIIRSLSIHPPRENMILKNLSGGNQQKVVFGRWLQFTPKILLLNDPTKGIDIQAKTDLFNIVNDLAKKGTSVILYSSSNEELIYNCDRVLVMFEGEIVDMIENKSLNEERLIRSSLRVRQEVE
jgi:ribose transport system ATP-binding protein